MKKELFVLLTALFLLQIVACERGSIEKIMPDDSKTRSGIDTSVHEPPARYISTSSTFDVIQRSSIIFLLVNVKSQAIKWQVEPQAQVDSRGEWAYITFEKSGPHRVYAIDSLSHDTTFIDVTVAKYYEQDFYDDDELFITPHMQPDSIYKLQ